MKNGKKLVILTALAANLLIAATKFGAAWWTGSSAILSEGVHSLVDTGDQVLLLYGMRQALRPPDEEFPFGHGKEIYFWSFVVSILIFSLGAGISIYEGILHLLHPARLENASVNYVIIAMAMAFEGISWLVSLRQFRRGKKPEVGYVQAIMQGKDPSLFLVLLEDSAAMLGLLAALAGIMLTQVTSNPIYDGGASVVIGLILGGTAILLARETKGLLVGEAADREAVRMIREIVSAGEHIEHVNEVLTLHMGPDYVVAAISLGFRDDIPAGDVEQTIKRLEETIKERVPEVQKVFIKAEPDRRRRTRVRKKRRNGYRRGMTGFILA
ncbi:cation diffusion facilitator family transporter [Geobacter sp. SVR]|uniref:cation diffusion facilitator family transporter n=1 Tax=Geobacter sp. SVR TaxID=2495594 RepID=UPI00143F01FB|nr:cation diffusion facilitator family transporter [Geobacter sp. SVR]BCS54201.1 cation transporter [Geobacter sp. SVR]GCF85940.1 cation transporter [Geobacter sp. SVR]